MVLREILWEGRSGPFPLLLGNRVFQVLGEASFSFYMFHVMVLLYLDRYKETLGLARYGPVTRAAIGSPMPRALPSPRVRACSGWS